MAAATSIIVCCDVIPQKETIPPGGFSVTGQVGDGAGITEWAVVRKIDGGFQPGRPGWIPFAVRIKQRYEYTSETPQRIARQGMYLRF